MKRLFLFLLFLTGTAGYAQNREITFETGSLQSALDKAKASNKLVFVDCYTEWCVPCKHMAKNIFTIDSVADFFNQNFVNVGLDMEKGDGIPALKTYKVGAFPSFLLLNGNGDLVYKFVGAMDADKFMSKVKEGMNPENKIARMNREYAAGNRDHAFIRDYIKEKINMMETNPAKEIAATYFNSLTDQQKVMPENWFLFGANRYDMYLSNVHSKNFDYLASNWKAFVKHNGKDTVEKRMGDMFRKVASYALNGFYFKEFPYLKAEFVHYRKQLIATNLKDKDQLILMMNMADAAGEKNWLKVSNILADHIQDFSPQNQRIAYDFWSGYGVSKREKLPRMKEISAKIIRTSKDPFIISTAKMYENY